jgi:hypothetical protein
MGAADGLREHRSRPEPVGPFGFDARGLRRTPAGPVAGDGGRAGDAAPVHGRPLPDPRRPGPHGPDPAQGPGRRGRRGLSDVAEHRPHPRPVAHHDPHGPGPRPVPPRPRAVRRGPPGRRRGPGRQGRRPGPGDHRARRGRGPGQGHRPPAAGRPVHADALDRRLRAVGPLQSADRAEPGPHLRPAGVQAHPRPDPRLSRDLEGLLSHAGQPRPPVRAGPRLAAYSPGRLPATRVRRPGRRGRARRLAQGPVQGPGRRTRDL